MSSPELVGYYRRRAAEYEEFYAWPSRQADFAFLKEAIPAALAGQEVLEVACGTGYWTKPISASAKRILATDIAEEPLAIALGKAYRCPVELRIADAYALEASLGSFEAAFAGFWWSHVPLSRRPAFLQSLHGRLRPGARVVMFDSRYVERVQPIAETDAEGNTFQRRRLSDGSEHLVLKNFPSEAEMRALLAPFAVSFQYRELRYCWLLEYRLR